MSDSPAAVTPIFDQLVAEFARRAGTSPAQEAAAGAGTPVEETATEACPGTAL